MSRYLKSTFAGMLFGVLVLFAASFTEVTARAPTLEYDEYEEPLCQPCGQAVSCDGNCEGEEDCCNQGASQGWTCLGC